MAEVYRFINGDVRRMTADEADAEVHSVVCENVFDLRHHWGRRSVTVDVVCPWNGQLMASYVADLD